MCRSMYGSSGSSSSSNNSSSNCQQVPDTSGQKISTAIIGLTHMFSLISCITINLIVISSILFPSLCSMMDDDDNNNNDDDDRIARILVSHRLNCIVVIYIEYYDNVMVL